MAEFDTTEFLAHHGIKGQKWGIRRFQNPDGTRTEAGKKRYGSGNNEKKSFQLSDDAKKAIKIGAVVAGTAMVAYGSYKLGQHVDAHMMKMAIDTGKEIVTKSATKTIAEMSDSEIDEKISRLKKEQELRKLMGLDPSENLNRLKNAREFEKLTDETLHPGAMYAKNILKVSGTRALSTIGAGAILYGAKAMVSGHFDKKEMANSIFKGGAGKK